MLRRHTPRFSLPILLLAGALLAASCDDPAGSPETERRPGGSDPLDPEEPGDPTGHLPPASDGVSPGLDPAIFPAVGSVSFVTANERELLSNGMDPGYGHNGRGEMWDDADASLDEAAPQGEAQGQPEPEPEPEAEPDPAREIVEADLFQLDGGMLYLLNRYRGLVTIDVSDPDHLRVAGRLPFQAQPVEMYLRDERAYIVMSDYFTYWQYDPDADPLGFHGSQILIVDVSDPANPLPLGGMLVEGEITDTRMVGDVLYTVSKRRPDYWRYNTADWEDRTWVASLNVADPRDIRQIDQITFSGMSTLIHVSGQAIFVAGWDPNFYLTDPDHEQETLLTYVDITDPDGALRERGSLYIPGYIADKFKMDWYEHTLRVMSQRTRYSGQGWLHMVDTTFPDALRLVASLEIGDESWGQLLASRYAGDRAYAMTSRWDSRGQRRIDLLHVLDLAVPTVPAETGVLSVDLRATHLQVHGDRLLALGQSELNGGLSDYKVQLSLYDVRDAARPAKLSSVRLGEGSSYTVANQDYKALRVLPELGLILVPLNWYRYVNNAYTSFNGTQLVDWQNDALVERGAIESKGRVQRAFPVGERLLAVSSEHVQSIDATDRDDPRETSSLFLVRTVYDVFAVGGFAVQLVGASFTSELRLEVLPFGKDDDAPAVASLTLPFSGQPVCYLDGSILHMIGFEQNRTGQIIRNADLTDPRQPRLVGELVLADGEAERIYSGGSGFYWRYWNPNAGLPLRNQILPFTVRRITEGEDGRRDWESELRLLDLRDPENPRIAAGRAPMNDFPFINKVTHGNILFSTHVVQATTEAGEGLLYHVRAYVDRIDVSDPDDPVLLPSLNVPGWLVDVSADGRLLYTVDYQWDDFGRRRNSLDVLRVEGDEAVLIDVLPVGDQVNRAVFRDRTIWITTHKYPWWGVRGETVASRQPYTLLHKVSIGETGTIAGLSQASLHGYHFDLLDLEQSTAYLASNGPFGLLVLDVEDPAEPVILNASRTIGYVSRLVRHEDFLYMPLGIYGVHRAPLTPVL